jgi:hypothetical protein
MATANWNDLLQSAEDVSYDAIPVGQYNATCESAEAETAQSGNLMITAVFVVDDGPYKGKKVWNRFVLVTDSQASLGHFFRHMNVFGMSKEYISSLPAPEAGGMAAMAGVIVGRSATIHVKIKQYNGEDQNEIGNFTPVGSPAPSGPAIGVPAGIPVPSAAPAVAAPAPAPAPVVAAPAPAPMPAGPSPAEQAAIEVPVPTPAPGIQPPQGNPAVPF